MDQPQLQMVLQVFADARLVENGRYAVPGNLRRRSDAGQQQHLRRAECTRRQDHFAAAARKLALAVLAEADAGRALAVEFDLLDQAAGFDAQVRCA